MTRLNYLDNVAGLLILYMMLYHILLWCDMRETIESSLMCLLSFFMFWFFFKSGMFYRAKGVKNLLLGGVKLMVPYVVFTLLGHIFQMVIMFVEGDTNWVHYVLSPIKQILLYGSLRGNSPLWFLFSLLLVQLIYNYLARKWTNIDIGIFIGSLFVAFLLNMIDIPYIPLYIANVFLGICCYSFGHLMRDRQFSKYVICLSIAIFLLLWKMTYAHVDFRINQVSNDSNYLLVVLWSFSGCMVINNVFKRLPNIRVLQYYGKYSMEFYVLHWLMLYVCLFVNKYVFQLGDYAMFFSMLISCVILLPFVIQAVYILNLGWVFGRFQDGQKRC